MYSECTQNVQHLNVLHGRFQRYASVSARRGDGCVRRVSIRLIFVVIDIIVGYRVIIQRGLQVLAVLRHARYVRAAQQGGLRSRLKCIQVGVLIETAFRLVVVVINSAVIIAGQGFAVSGLNRWSVRIQLNGAGRSAVRWLLLVRLPVSGDRRQRLVRRLLAQTVMVRWYGIVVQMHAVCRTGIRLSLDVLAHRILADHLAVRRVVAHRTPVTSVRILGVTRERRCLLEAGILVGEIVGRLN